MSKGDVTGGSVRVRKILCCVDFSGHSEQAVKYSLSLGDAYDAEVTVLHVLVEISNSEKIETETTGVIENLGSSYPLPMTPSRKLTSRCAAARHTQKSFNSHRRQSQT
jgi:hypothetical protein